MGEPAPVLSHVGHNVAFGLFDCSANALAYRNAPGEEMAQMAWFDRHGTRAASFGESASLYSQLVLSPDGSHVVPYLNRLSDLLWTLARWQEGTFIPARENRNP